MTKEQIILAVTVGVGLAILMNMLIRKSIVVKAANDIVNDTMKRDGKWDPTRITMFVAFGSILWAFHFDTIKNLKVNEELFLIMAAIATGVSIARAYSKKLNPDGPKEGAGDEQK